MPPEVAWRRLFPEVAPNGKNFVQYFVRFLGNGVSRKIAFEIYSPLECDAESICRPVTETIEPFLFADVLKARPLETLTNSLYGLESPQHTQQNSDRRLKFSGQAELGMQDYICPPPPPIFGRYYNFIPIVAQCVELKLRWRFCVHASTWPELYF